MIKNIVDLLRGTDGYAGMAIYRGRTLLFSEAWEPPHIARVLELFDGLAARTPARAMTLVVQGYTINVCHAGDLLVACRSEGRFVALPEMPDEEPEYAAGQAPAGLISREEARKEAQAMLKMLLGRG